MSGGALLKAISDATLQAQAAREASGGDDDWKALLRQSMRRN